MDLWINQEYRAICAPLVVPLSPELDTRTLICKDRLHCSAPVQLYNPPNSQQYDQYNQTPTHPDIMSSSTILSPAPAELKDKQPATLTSNVLDSNSAGGSTADVTDTANDVSRVLHGEPSNEAFLRKDVSEAHYKPTANYEGLHRYDPEYVWEPSEEKRLVRKVNSVILLLLDIHLYIFQRPCCISIEI